MSYPALDLQKGLHDVLTAALAPKKVYDTVPAGAVFPYLTMGDVQVLDDGNTCSTDMFEAFADIHVWSRIGGSQVEAKTVSAQVWDALKAPFAVPNWTITTTELQTARHFRDSDGITAHSVFTFRFLIEPA